MKPINIIAIFAAATAVILIALVVFLPVFAKEGQYSRHPLPTAVQAKSDSAKLLLNEGRQARRDGDLTTAEDKLQQCLNQHTIWDEAAAKELGRIYNQRGENDKAFTAYQQAFSPVIHSYSDFPKDVEALAHYGLLAQQNGQYTEAARVYEQVRTRLNPAPPVAIDVHFDSQRPQPASLRAMLHVVRGIALQEQGDMGSALAAFRQAVQADPKQATAQFYLGRGLQKAGRTAEAKAAFAKAAQLDSGPVREAAQKAMR